MGYQVKCFAKIQENDISLGAVFQLECPFINCGYQLCFAGEAWWKFVLRERKNVVFFLVIGYLAKDDMLHDLICTGCKSKILVYSLLVAYFVSFLINARNCGVRRV